MKEDYEKLDCEQCGCTVAYADGIDLNCLGLICPDCYSELDGEDE